MHPTQDAGLEACSDPRRGWALPSAEVWVDGRVLVVGFGPEQFCDVSVPLLHGSLAHYTRGVRSGSYHYDWDLVACVIRPLPGSHC